MFRASLMLAIAAFLPAPARAHGAFDHNTRVWLFEDHLEITITLGPEAAKIFLNNGPAEVLRSGRMEVVFPFPPASAARLFEIKSGGILLEPSKATVRSDGLEFDFGFFYSRPDTGTLSLNARYLGETPTLSKGSMVIVDEDGKVLAGKILSANENSLEFTLPAKTNTAPLAGNGQEIISTNGPTAIIARVTPPPISSSFAQFVKLGVEHILTGFDHLLFLCALLIGVRKLGPMLAVITCFTLAHSVTLALAATNVVSIPTRVVEPIIAASIVVVGLENLWRRDMTQDRYWLAGGFGLIHGFGFASALRETGLGGNGVSIVMPLFAFNFGVECGQLAVAAVVVPLLFWLRRAPSFARFATPAISTAVIAVSSYWLVERTLFSR